MVAEATPVLAAKVVRCQERPDKFISAMYQPAGGKVADSNPCVTGMVTGTSIVNDEVSVSLVNRPSAAPLGLTTYIFNVCVPGAAATTGSVTLVVALGARLPVQPNDVGVPASICVYMVAL